jgi:hypothetical protein
MQGRLGKKCYLQPSNNCPMANVYASLRWRLGLVHQAGLGLACLAALLSPLPAWAEASWGGWAGFALAGAAALLSLPFDYAAGWRLPSRRGRAKESARAWLLRWLRATALHAALLGLGFALARAAFGWLGLAGLAAGMLLFMLLLSGTQVYLALLGAASRWSYARDRGRSLYWLEAGRPFSGGISGIPGQEMLVLPAFWQEKLSPASLEALLLRRHGAINTGSRGAGLILAWLLNLGLFCVLAWAWQGKTGGIVYTVLTFSILSPAFDLLLAGLSRRAAYQLDRWAYFQRLDGDKLRRAIEEYERWMEVPEEGRLLRPLASRRERLEALGQQGEALGAWLAAGMARYCSWAGCNLLARASGLSSGDPQALFFPPAD